MIVKAEESKAWSNHVIKTESQSDVLAARLQVYIKSVQAGGILEVHLSEALGSLENQIKWSNINTSSSNVLGSVSLETGMVEEVVSIDLTQEALTAIQAGLFDGFVFLGTNGLEAELGSVEGGRPAVLFLDYPGGAGGISGDDVESLKNEISKSIKEDEQFKNEIKAGAAVSTGEVADILKNDQDFIAATKGPKGDRGPQGLQGDPGSPGTDGSDGKDGEDADPNQIAQILKNDNDFINSTKGPRGPKGQDGTSPTAQSVANILKNDNDFINQTKGDKGDTPTKVTKTFYASINMAEAGMPDNAVRFPERAGWFRYPGKEHHDLTLGYGEYLKKEVYLPDGAIIKKVTFRVEDTDESASPISAKMFFARTPIGSSSSYFGLCSSNLQDPSESNSWTSLGNDKYELKCTGSLKLDYTSNSYTIFIDFRDSPNKEILDDWKQFTIWPVIIEYTLDVYP